MNADNAERIQRARDNLQRYLAEGTSPLDLTRWMIADIVVQAVRPDQVQIIRTLFLTGDIESVRAYTEPSGNFLVGTLLELGWTHPDITADDIPTFTEES